MSHCDCGEGPCGVPLDTYALAGMPDEERTFWMEFLEQAMNEINEADEKGEERPLVPSVSLRQKRQRALSEFDGQKYCQMGQLKQIFDFSLPS